MPDPEEPEGRSPEGPEPPDRNESPNESPERDSTGVRGQTSPISHSVYWRPPSSPTGAGRFVTVALSGTIGVLAVLIATSLSVLINRDRWTDSTGSDLVPFALGWLAGVGFAVAGIGILTGIAWMVWQHRAHANLFAMKDDALRPSTVWWWLVPVASVFMPFLAVRDLAKGDHDRPGLRRWWWFFYVLFGVVSGLTTVLPIDLA
jgi:hypothetical protein